MRQRVMIAACIVCAWVCGAAAQSSSMLRASAPRWAPANDPSASNNASANSSSTENTASFATRLPSNISRPATRTLEQTSLIAIERRPPRKFKPEDLITIIVRQQKQYEADAKLDTEKKWKLDGALSEWFRFYPDHHLGSDQLTNGQPSFKFDFKDRRENEGESEREDKFITRIAARVIDVKPNGNLVLEAKQMERHDEELIEITLTGVCRSEDVTPDNSVLSTQIAELVLVEKNSGAVRDAARRGWIPRALDFVRPF